MNHDGVVMLLWTIAPLWWIVEMGLVYQWSRYPFHGPRFSTRRSTIDLSKPEVEDLVRVVAEDEDLIRTNIRIKKRTPDKYHLQIPWMIPGVDYEKHKHLPLWPVFFTGRLVLDRKTSEIRLSLHFIPSILTILLTRLGIQVWQFWSAEEYGDIAFFLLALVGLAVLIYSVLFKWNLNNFWFLLTTKLGSLNKT